MTTTIKKTMSAWAALLLLGSPTALLAATDYDTVDQEKWHWACNPASNPHSDNCVDMTVQLVNSNDEVFSSTHYKYKNGALNMFSGVAPCKVEMTDGSTETFSSFNLRVNNFEIKKENKTAQVLRFHVPDNCLYEFNVHNASKDRSYRAEPLSLKTMFDHPKDPTRKCGRFNVGEGDQSPTMRECFTE